MITKFKIFENVNNFNIDEYAMNYDAIDDKYNNFYANCASSLVDYANINKGDLVLELGSGTGFSTLELIKHAGNSVIATEYGEAMFNVLKNKVDNAYKLDARYLRKFVDEMNLENKIDIVFSNFTYFYFYNFEDVLFKNIWEKCLKEGGKYAFNLTNFLTYFRYDGVDYNSFYHKIRKGFDDFLIEEGYEGVGDDKIIGDCYNVKKKLYLAGFNEVIMEPHHIDMKPSKALEFMVNNFYSYGFDVSWSSTLKKLPIEQRMDLLNKGSEYIKEYIDKNNDRPTIMNIVAYK